MEDYIRGFIKDAFLGIFVLFIGILVDFDWFFWLLILFLFLQFFIKERRRRQNRPPD